jgi:uncharacterized protein YacL
MTGGTAIFYLLYANLTTTPFFGLPVAAISLPYIPLVLTAILCYFMASLFMDIFELAVLTFMFVRDKNTEELQGQYGPDSPEIREIDEKIATEDHAG